MSATIWTSSPKYKTSDARVFAFGIGSAVNRFLLDKMSEHGRGEVEYVGLQDDGSAAARRFHERIRNPLLTRHFRRARRPPSRQTSTGSASRTVQVSQSALIRRYTEGRPAPFDWRGKQAGRDAIREIRPEPLASQARHDVVVPTSWGMYDVEHLMGQDYKGIQQGHAQQEVREAITQNRPATTAL